MELIINSHKQDLPSEINKAQYILQAINDYSNKTKLIFSHLLIDGGNEQYGVSEQMMPDLLQSVSLVEAIFLEEKEYYINLLKSSEEYLINVKSSLEQLIEKYYMNSVGDDTWKSFLDFIEGLTWLSNVVSIVNRQFQFHGDDEKGLDVALIEKMRMLEEAVINRDNTLIADILKYEIQPILEGFKNELNLIV